MTAASVSRWYLVQTQVNNEFKAAQNLVRQGYKIYLPCYLKRRRHARKVDVVSKPLFPRYMFVAIDAATQGWHSIQSTFGVSHLVSNGSDPAIVPAAVVRAIQAREDAKGFIQMDSTPTFAPGDAVRVQAGAFIDNTGFFSGLADHDRVAILLDMLGRKVRVLLDVDMVVAA